jgi:NAD(P)-dependent dehydrogenase (short-subunit alcohol dehydrogenase family)
MKAGGFLSALLFCTSPITAIAFAPCQFGSTFKWTCVSLRAEFSNGGSISFGAIQGKRILVVGGSGRVGGSVVTQLMKRGAKVIVGSTNLESFEVSRSRWQQMFEFLDTNSIDFASLDREDPASIASVLKEKLPDMVVHTAGPFQGKVSKKNGVIDACVSNQVAYVDVCDDYCTAMAAKSKYSERAKKGSTPCIISTGCWPGVSSLMAKQLARKVLATDKSLQHSDLTVDFSFFTAGSGGAGSTLLVATFLILAEEALTVVNGRRKPVKAMVGYEDIEFGEIVGIKPVAPLNLLETASVHDILGVGNVKALFGTAPGFWNTLLGLMAQLPSSLLANEEIMTKLALFSLPIVRLVDYFAGATNAMRVDVTADKAPRLKATAIYAHENLEPCVGECVVAFCSAVLSNKVSPGVWFPEEAITTEQDISDVLSLASVGAHTTDVGGLVTDTAYVWGGRDSKRMKAERNL